MKNEKPSINTKSHNKNQRTTKKDPNFNKKGPNLLLIIAKSPKTLVNVY